MASPISASVSLCCSPSTSTKSTICLVPYSKASKFHVSPWFSQLGSAQFSSYSGLRHLGISISPKSLKLERKRRCRGKVVHASLFGVGAPEALVIGVVALLVFGPKGLAEVARNLGKTLRAFQPTIRELQDVSREFKSTLEREIGLDELSTPSSYRSNATNIPSPISSSPASSENPGNVADPNGALSPEDKAYTSEAYLKITEEQLKASAALQLDPTSTSGESQLKPETQPQDQETASATPQTQTQVSDSKT
ncbi:sec-independent protein translocase protein TATB, chloroplastic isoform X2 [Carica papaya]|uniref:sec-independent protein translocase protein TATB, chloroplastic isoform X2 n=1 Tax=Carica papaya TaxID=3649 RepID=UPI000B8CFBC8|nr:sec-independent protein translocase protein TATB, chloroplastic isoform X2 [Carica papaya]